SWSLTVVPSVTDPARGIVPVAASSASTSVVFPALEWPTTTTLRTLLGSSTTGAGPATPFSWLFCAISGLPSTAGARRIFIGEPAHVSVRELGQFTSRCPH